MKELLQKLSGATALTLVFTGLGMSAQAQAPALYSTVNGKVWIEGDAIASDGIQSTPEQNLSGILVRLITTSTPNRVIAVGMTNASGNYTLNNYEGAGTYTVQFYYPNEAFVGVAQTAPTLPGSQSHVTRVAGNTRATVVVNAPAQTNTINMGLLRNTNFIVSCGTYSGATTWNQNIAVPKYDYTGAADVSLWSATNSFHSDIVVTENSSAPTNLNARIGIQTTVTYPDMSPATELYSQAATTLISENFNGNETKHFYNLNNSAVYSQSNYSMNYAPVNSGAGTLNIPVVVQGQTTFTGATNFQVDLPTVASFGACLVYEASSPLAVTLISLTAGVQNGVPQLKWQTAAEKNCRGFEIEHSTDGTIWSNIGFVASKGENGNATNTLSYEFDHKSVTNGKHFYRLRQVDVDGKVTLSKTVSVLLQSGAAVVQLYPNVIDQNASRFTLAGLSGNSEIAVFNIAGARVIYTTSANDTEVIDMSGIPSGTYQVLIRDLNSKTLSTEKVIKR
ncbi:MAG: T9SS type A sorting domain-containing protein [Sphingobacteriales bacterium]|nr:MAG: T9SS type A sorting domain-containing protein [Sphingobacteriales bacterium]